MHIKEIRITPIALGDPPLLNASGLHAPYALRIIIEIFSDNGLVGISEIPGDINILNVFNEIKKEPGKIDPYDIEKFKNKLRGKFKEDKTRGDQSFDSRILPHVESAVEVASLDLIGKKENKRVAELVGEVVREKVPFAGYLFFKYKGVGGKLGFETNPKARGWAKVRQKEALTPEDILKQAKAMKEEFGFKAFKLKAGILDPEIEVNSILTLRKEFGPDVPLRIDPNASWSFETALKYGKILEGIIEYYEDPVRGQEEMARLRQNLNIPFATNMATTSFDDLPKSIELHSEDIILLDHHFWGGIKNAHTMSQKALDIDREISMHSNSHAGVSMMAMTHLGSIVPSLTTSLDTHYPWQEDDVIVGEKIKIEDGFVNLPKNPGLGIEIDQKKLKKMHQQYIDSRLVGRNDEIEMQKINPDWKFKKTRY